MTDPMDRFEDIMATVEPRERRYLRWRVAPDVVDAIAGRKITDYRGLQIMGYPADVDEALTAGTIEYDTGGRVVPPGWEEAVRAAGFAPDLDDDPEDSLDDAWAEAEAALPEGWFIGGLELLRLPTRNRPLWWAMAVQPMTIGGGRVSGEADASPAAALRALAAKLREAR